VSQSGGGPKLTPVDLFQLKQTNQQTYLPTLGGQNNNLIENKKYIF
jgi:hypothetical protein